MTLSQATIDEIEAAAEDQLLANFGSSSFPPVPINVNQVAARLEIGIRQGSFEDPNIAGVYDPKARAIFLPENEPPYRQVFSVGHELGHVVLGHELDAQEVYYRQTDLAVAPPKEQEANWFAAALLMPREMVRAYWPTVQSASTLAGIFGVSPTAMLYRLRNLNLVTD